MRARVLSIPLVLGFIALVIQENISDSYTTVALVESYSQWTVRELNDVLMEEHILQGMRVCSRQWETTGGDPVNMERASGIEPGSLIRAGEPVLTIWNPLAGLQCETAHARLNAERTELAVLEAATREEELDVHLAALDAAGIEKEESELAFARASSLYSAELISREEYEIAHYDYESALAGLKKAEAYYRLAQAGTAGELRDAQRAEIRIREMELQEATARAETTIITSPIDGIITDPEPGIVLRVQQTDTVLVYVPVEQDWIRKIARGARADIKGPGGIRAVGRVTHIGSAARAIGDQIAIPVVVTVANPNGMLKPGMTVDASIEV